MGKHYNYSDLIFIFTLLLCYAFIANVNALTLNRFHKKSESGNIEVTQTDNQGKIYQNDVFLQSNSEKSETITKKKESKNGKSFAYNVDNQKIKQHKLLKNEHHKIQLDPYKHKHSRKNTAKKQTNNNTKHKQYFPYFFPFVLDKDRKRKSSRPSKAKILDPKKKWKGLLNQQKNLIKQQTKLELKIHDKMNKLYKQDLNLQTHKEKRKL